ncbi:MFS transporter [Bariatricus massiliensis]|uniref:MFS transporter n=1 Tax=Bariatricus massiliensis TaxID=1745713 RepID=A0ABS8DGP0_9FIRM|nr:MFS transporter [Bariatricus massiliensis]MCB7304481.1 MFS transporter [Bariatricus massiliensis]MCB7375133.1 MFS transporter [Bariatricus massiliensis]MCB7387592.1 MFS transporter [Bariatricus massiliensis]MCB7411753.1 MFS transporter [Bariatricus massiliensis]MCQ5253889.1 MFS transporter [Bariatricus massiliensis]
MEKKREKIHYAWFILGACVLINIIVQSLVMQVSALYILPMYNDLQIPRTLLSLQSVMITVGAVVSAPVWGKIYKTKDARKLLPMSVAVTALCTIGRSFMPNIWCILPLSFIKGIFFTGSTLLPISILLTAWFKEKRGFAISVATIGTSIGGVIFNPVVEKLISTYGWRTADRVTGALMFVITVPCLYAIIRNRPKDKGLLPYGVTDIAALKGNTQQKQEVLTGMTMKEAMKSPILYLFLFAVLAMTFANGAALQTPTYLADIGYGTAVAARAASAYAAVGIFGKLILGSIVDKFGEKKGVIYICSVTTIAYICFIFARSRVAFFGLILFYGLSTGMVSVMPTLLTSKIFGNRDYGPIYGVVVSVNRFGGIIGNLLVSLLFDITGNYSIIWPACAVMIVLTLISILACMAMSKKKMSVAVPEAGAEA